MGKPVAYLGGKCLGANLGDKIARGYITFDSTSRCAIDFPSDPGYFGPGATANDRNTLWGDYVVVRPGGEVDPQPLLHLEADAALETATGATFYGSLPSAQPGGQRPPRAARQRLGRAHAWTGPACAAS